MQRLCALGMLGGLHVDHDRLHLDEHNVDRNAAGLPIRAAFRYMGRVGSRGGLLAIAATAALGLCLILDLRVDPREQPIALV